MAGNDPLSVGGVCERAREWASLRLDGELSVLEEELLDRHLDVCDACDSFEAEMRSTTSLLRRASVETPARPLRVAPRPEAVPLARRRTAVVAAAALALGAVVGSFVERPGAPAPSTPPSQVSLLMREDVEQLRDLPSVKRFLSPVPIPSAPSNPPEGVI